MRCCVERNTLTALRDPSSLMGYCLGDYSQCPSWQEEKKHVERGFAAEFLDMEDKRTAREMARDLGGEIEYEPIEYTDFVTE